ncbi:MAG: hypothetical protein AAFX56_09080 [Pseudomonadota bacterium]
MTLALSIVALLLGPFVYEFGRRRPTLRQLLDGLVFITIAGIVCIHIIPEAISVGGAVAIVFLLFGLAFPVVLEQRFHDAVPQAHGFILLLAALGMTVHAALDGIALLPAGDAAGWEDHQLAASVILHRLPVGMAIWWSLRPNFGSPLALAAFVLIIVVTALAYFIAGPVVALAEAESVAWFQAFVSGSLVHVVAFGVSHDHAAQPAAKNRDWAYRVGILIGLLLIFTVPHVVLH